MGYFTLHLIKYVYEFTPQLGILLCNFGGLHTSTPAENTRPARVAMPCTCFRGPGKKGDSEMKIGRKINPKDWQVLSLGGVGFLLFFRVVSGDYGKPWNWSEKLVLSCFLGGGNSNIFYVHPYLGKFSNLTDIFQMGWNHQPVLSCFCLLVWDELR